MHDQCPFFQSQPKKNNHIKSESLKDIYPGHIRPSSVCCETQKRNQCWASTYQNRCWMTNHFSNHFQQVKSQVGIDKTHYHRLLLPENGKVTACCQHSVLHSHWDAKRRINPSPRPSTGFKGHKTIKVSQNNGSLPFISGKVSPLIDRRHSFQTFKAVPKVWGTTSVHSVSGLKTPPPPPTVWQLLWWFGRHSAAAWQLQYIT